MPTTPTDALDTSPAALASDLRVSVMRLARRLRLERASEGYTLNQLSAIAVLDRMGDLTVGELAEIERVKPPSMTRTVNCLVDAGLAARRPHDSDGRQVVVGLTDLARSVLVEDRRRRHQWLSQRLDELDPADRELLARVAPLLDSLAAAQ
jgi:DNA-binding MarR family transcriptional regulator